MKLKVTATTETMTSATIIDWDGSYEHARTVIKELAGSQTVIVNEEGEREFVRHMTRELLQKGSIAVGGTLENGDQVILNVELLNAVEALEQRINEFLGNGEFNTLSIGLR